MKTFKLLAAFAFIGAIAAGCGDKDETGTEETAEESGNAANAEGA